MPAAAASTTNTFIHTHSHTHIWKKATVSDTKGTLNNGLRQIKPLFSEISKHTTHKPLTRLTPHISRRMIEWTEWGIFWFPFFISLCSLFTHTHHTCCHHTNNQPYLKDKCNNTNGQLWIRCDSQMSAGSGSRVTRRTDRGDWNLIGNQWSSFSADSSSSESSQIIEQPVRSFSSSTGLVPLFFYTICWSDSSTSPSMTVKDRLENDWLIQSGTLVIQLFVYWKFRTHFFNYYYYFSIRAVKISHWLRLSLSYDCWYPAADCDCIVILQREFYQRVNIWYRSQGTKHKLIPYESPVEFIGSPES